MNAEIIQTKIPGCLIIRSNKIRDSRGYFQKVFNEPFFSKSGIDMEIAEQYFSISNKGVIRGLHFQLPKMDHQKMVYCLTGKIMDVVVDLRVGSPTYGKYEIFHLNENNADIIFIPKGLAHGFYSFCDNSIMVYNVSTVYSKEHDAGILWSSLDIPWSVESAVISERDKSFVKFADFKSPFIYREDV